MNKNKNYPNWSPVPNNPRDNELYVDKKDRSSEKKFNRDNMIFGSTEKESRYGYRTVTGHWKNRDEPDDETQLKQADAINKMMQKRKAASGRERLKMKGAVPVRAASGKKLFEEFCREAYENRKQIIDDVKNSKDEGVLKCVQCGMCTSTCPAAQHSDYNPREIIERVLDGDESILEDLSERFTESVQRYIAGQIDNIALNSIAIQLAEAVAKDQDISFERAYDIAAAYVEEMLEESTAQFKNRIENYVFAVNSNAKYDSENFEEAYYRSYRGELGLASKRSFKRNELEHELRHEVEPRRPSYTPRPSTPQAKIYHKVPYAQKEDAKKEGMRWDPDKKKWYHSDHAKSSASKFQKEEVEISEATKGDKEHTAFQKFMAARRLKQVEKSSTKKSQKWRNKQTAKKNLPEQVEIDEEKIPVKKVVDGVTKLMGNKSAVNFMNHLRPGTDTHTSWDKINNALTRMGTKTQHIASIAAHVKPAQYKEEVEQIDELSKGTIASYLDKVRFKQAKRAVKANMGAPREKPLASAALNRTGASMDKARARLAKEEVELDEAIPYALSAANYNASPSSSKYKGEVNVPLKHVGGTADYKAIKKHVASKGLKVDSIGTGDGYKTVTLASNQHTADELKRKLGIKEETSPMDLYLEALQSNLSILK